MDSLEFSMNLWDNSNRVAPILQGNAQSTRDIKLLIVTWLCYIDLTCICGGF